MDLRSLSSRLSVNRVLLAAQELSARVRTLSRIESLLEDQSIADCLPIIRNYLESSEAITVEESSAIHCKPDSIQGRIPEIETLSSLLMEDVCPSLLRLVLKRDVESSCVLFEITAELCKLYAACSRHVSSASRVNAVVLLVGVLSDHGRVSNPQLVNVIEALAKIFSLSHTATFFGENNIIAGLFDVLIQLLMGEDEQLVGSILVLLIPAITTSGQTSRTPSEKPLVQFWSRLVVRFGEIEQSEPVVARVLFILCGLLDLYLSAADSSSLSASLMNVRSIWTFVQLGLRHSDSLARKRALYVFRRILDFSTSEASAKGLQDSCENTIDEISVASLRQWKDVWLEFILLLEMLEEKQVHLIMPILSRFYKMVDATMLSGVGLSMHTSWLVTVFLRMSLHESLLIRRWAVMAVLSLDFSACPLLRQNCVKFLATHFVSMILEPAIYYRTLEDIAECLNPVANLLAPFFSSVNRNLPVSDKKVFWTTFLHTLGGQNWDGSALVFVTCSLAQLEPTGVVVNLEDFRNLLSSRVKTFHILQRTAIQCFTLRAFISLVDCEALSVAGLTSLIGCVCSDDVILRRRSHLWCHLVDWLKAKHSVLVRDQPQQTSFDECVLGTVSRWLSESLDEGGDRLSSSEDALGLARLVVLSADAGLFALSPDPNYSRVSFRQVLLLAFDALESAVSHVYISRTRIERSLSFVLSISSVLDSSYGVGTGDIQVEIFNALCKQSADAVLYHLTRSLSEAGNSSSKKKENISLNLYSSFVRTLPSHVGLESFLSMSGTAKLLDFTLSQLSNPSCSEAMLCSGMEIAAAMCSFLPCEPQTSISKKMQQFLCSWQTVINRPSNSCRGYEWSSYLENQWSCISWFVGAVKPVPERSIALIEAAEETLDVAGPGALIACFGSLKYLLPTAHDDVVERVLRCAWRKVLDLQINSLFRSVFTAYVKLAFQKDFILSLEKPRTLAFLAECFNEILDLGEDKCGLVNVLVNILCAYANRHDACQLNNFAPCLAKCLLFGPARGKANRLFVDVYKYLSHLSFYSPEDFYDHTERDDVAVRAAVIGLLTNCPSPAFTGDKHRTELGGEVVRNLVAMHRGVLSKRTRCYANSDAHRRSQRIVTALLLLDQRVVESAEELFQYLAEVIELETQPSVRHVAEWLLIRIVNAKPSLQSRVWKNFSEASERKVAYLCSLCLIITHVGKLLPSDLLVNYVTSAFPRLLPWCMMGNFNIRTFAQSSLMCLWRFVLSKGLRDVVTGFNVLESMNTFMHSNTRANPVSMLAILLDHLRYRPPSKGEQADLEKLVNVVLTKITCSCSESNLVRPVLKSPDGITRDCCQSVNQLLDTFSFTFHPLDDFNIETILHSVPRLTGLADDEWITVDDFVAANPDWHSAHVALRSRTDYSQRLIKAKQPGGSSSDHSMTEVEGNVQRKMVPWRSLMPTSKLDQDDSTASRHLADGFVLVTSLIDRPPNLGGLCRTCEIFGVSKFIIGNLRFVDDKNFESLSVTSQKWIDVEEVRPDQLKPYLLEMKSRGYRLVGAEQTTSGQKLGDYRFPRQTLLVLGNEKTGIPVDILQVLDVCVEVPQRGLIRSLNVHVSGALFIWEYYKQWSLSPLGDVAK